VVSAQLVGVEDIGRGFCVCSLEQALLKMSERLSCRSGLSCVTGQHMTQRVREQLTRGLWSGLSCCLSPTLIDVAVGT
jgi:hypothetical protein